MGDADRAGEFIIITMVESFIKHECAIEIYFREWGSTKNKF